MVRYRCAECGKEYDRVERYREEHGEERTCCPQCGAPAEDPCTCCAVCGGTIEGELEVCAACAEEHCRRNWRETAAWLKARTGGLGWFSWRDFVLGEDCTHLATQHLIELLYRSTTFQRLSRKSRAAILYHSTPLRILLLWR